MLSGAVGSKEYLPNVLLGSFPRSANKSGEHQREYSGYKSGCIFCILRPTPAVDQSDVLVKQVEGTGHIQVKQTKGTCARRDMVSLIALETTRCKT